MTKAQKSQIDNEVMQILGFHCKVLGLNPLEMPKAYGDLAISMFVEGVKFWKEKTK